LATRNKRITAKRPKVISFKPSSGQKCKQIPN
jgi:hypothetical protein